MSWTITFTASGRDFRPSQVDFRFAHAIEPGSIAQRGRFKGQPVPFGYAEIEYPTGPEATPGKHLLNLCKLAHNLKPALQAAGATDFEIVITRVYSDQCNEELSAEELNAIAALNCPISYTAYKSESSCQPA